MDSSNPAFLKAFAALSTVWLALIAGAALTLYISTIPIIREGGSSRVILRQFHRLIILGARYLQTGSRILAFLLAVLAYLLYRHPDSDVASRWKYFAAALFVLLQVAWYEVVFVFPFNDKLVEMEDELSKADEPTTMDLYVRAEVLRLLEEWQRGHVGRILIPLLSTTLAIYGLIF